MLKHLQWLAAKWQHA